MKITERDVEILKFINDFGFCQITHIEKKFNIRKPRSYKILSRLVKAGLVIHKRVFYNRHGIFHLSKRGARYTELPQLAKIPLAIYDHQLTVIEQYFKLMHQYPGALWISERRLKREKFVTDLDRHVADGMLISPEGDYIAIEVELTLKAQDRLMDIFVDYATTAAINEVRYYCSPTIATKIAKLAEDFTLIKVHTLEM